MTELWTLLRQEQRPIVLYGMGNGADKLLAVCEKKGVSVSGVFASDGFARGNLFHGMPVMTFDQAKARFGEFTVLLAFASCREEVLGNIRRIAKICPLYVPDLPVMGETLFDLAFYQENEPLFQRARALFADERSVQIFDLIVKSKLTGALDPLFEGISCPDEDFETILHPEGYKICIDLGAYTGDTALDLLKRAPKIQQIVALEPDPKTFRKLEKNTAGLPVVAVNGAAWDGKETLFFTASGGRGAGVGAAGKKEIPVQGIPADELLDPALRVDYLKLDVEGAEHRALQGAHGLISRHRPELLVSCYHRPEDLFSLPLYLKEHYPFYDLYLRRHGGVPAWDINLYAVPKKEGVL